MDISILDEFTEERTQHRVTPLPVEAFGLEGTLLRAVQELTPAQVVAVATMTLDERCKAMRMALDFDDLLPTIPRETRQQAERWLASVARERDEQVVRP